MFPLDLVEELLNGFNPLAFKPVTRTDLVLRISRELLGGNHLLQTPWYTFGTTTKANPDMAKTHISSTRAK